MAENATYMDFGEVEHGLVLFWDYNLGMICNVVTSTSVVTGFVSFVFIIGCMPMLTTVKTKAKLFYVSIAISQIPGYVFVTVLLYFVCNVVPEFAPDAVFQFEGLSLAACQVSRLFGDASENAAAFLTLLFAVERLVVVTQPFKAHLFNVKRSACAILLLVLQAVAVNRAAFHIYYKDPTDPANSNCTPKPDVADLIFGLFVIDYLLPNSLLLLVAVFITMALQKSHKRTAHLASGSNQGAKAPRGRKSTRILIFMACVRCVTYLPWSVLYIVYPYVPDANVAYTVRIYANFFYIFCELLVISDFIVYLLCIQEFRKRVMCRKIEK